MSILFEDDLPVCRMVPMKNDFFRQRKEKREKAMHCFMSGSMVYRMK